MCTPYCHCVGRDPIGRKSFLMCNTLLNLCRDMSNSVLKKSEQKLTIGQLVLLPSNTSGSQHSIFLFSCARAQIGDSDRVALISMLQPRLFWLPDCSKLIIGLVSRKSAIKQSYRIQKNAGLVCLSNRLPFTSIFMDKNATRVGQKLHYII